MEMSCIEVIYTVVVVFVGLNCVFKKIPVKYRDLIESEVSLPHCSLMYNTRLLM